MIETLALTLGALVAGIISGATGFGFALAGTAMWSLTLEPRLVAVLAVVFTTVLNLGYLPVLTWKPPPDLSAVCQRRSRPRLITK